MFLGMNDQFTCSMYSCSDRLIILGLIHLYIANNIISESDKDMFMTFFHHHPNYIYIAYLTHVTTCHQHLWLKTQWEFYKTASLICAQTHIHLEPEDSNFNLLPSSPVCSPTNREWESSPMCLRKQVLQKSMIKAVTGYALQENYINLQDLGKISTLLITYPIILKLVLTITNSASMNNANDFQVLWINLICSQLKPPPEASILKPLTDPEDLSLMQLILEVSEMNDLIQSSEHSFWIWFFTTHPPIFEILCYYFLQYDCFVPYLQNLNNCFEDLPRDLDLSPFFCFWHHLKSIVLKGNSGSWMYK